jgi:hypothetical protein
MSKAQFVKEVEAVVAGFSVEAREYFEKTVKAKKVNKKEVEKAKVVKNAILAFLTENKGKMFDRVELANALFNAAEFDEEFLLNEKGTLAYNSMTAFANQLVADGLATKDEVRVGKTKKVKYSVN